SFKNYILIISMFSTMYVEIMWRAGLFPGGAWGLRPRTALAATNMETLYRVPFLVLECPNLKLKKPPWLHMPSAMTVYALVVVSYFLITGGIIYDVIVEPPSVGSMTDEHGHQRPVAFLAYRVNGQYIMEGLASSFLFTMGGLGFIILDRSNAPNIPKLNRFLLLFIGFVCVLLSFFMARVFMRMKLP
uniref:Oligosaccharyltransferase complex subunit n=1 Tax=Pan troglodytes TaxID=9598 RepID=A0A2I3SGA2_PANTR